MPDQKAHVNFGQSFSQSSPCHFVQPNTIEDEPGLEWKLQREQMAMAVNEALHEYKDKLTNTMKEYIQASFLPYATPCMIGLGAGRNEPFQYLDTKPFSKPFIINSKS